MRSSRLMVCSATAMRKSSNIHRQRSTIRQRTTPWIAGVGRSSIIFISAARCASLSFGGWPGTLRSMRSVGAMGVELHHPIAHDLQRSHRRSLPPRCASRRRSIAESARSRRACAASLVFFATERSAEASKSLRAEITRRVAPCTGTTRPALIRCHKTKGSRTKHGDVGHTIFSIKASCSISSGGTTRPPRSRASPSSMRMSSNSPRRRSSTSSLLPTFCT